jgi:hypothetical protein
MSSDQDGRYPEGADRDSTSFPAPPAPPAVVRPDCRGGGRIVLLTSSRACGRCGGGGRVPAAGGSLQRTDEEADGTIRTYDEIGRIIQIVRPNQNTVVTSYEAFPR